MASKFVNNYLPELSATIFGRSKPSMVTVNLTSRCDQHCIYCEIGTKSLSSRKGSLTIEDMSWIIDQMAEAGIHRISLCGGEPFLFEGIMDVVSYAGKKNIRCTITTNGMTGYKLSDADLNILEEFDTQINISIDSFQESIQTLTRGTPDAFSNALKSIYRLNERHIPVTVLTAISKYNYHNLYDFLRTAYEKGIKQVLFQPIIYYSNYPDRQAIDQKAQFNVCPENLGHLMDELRKILQFERKHRINTNVYRILPWIESYIKTASNQDGQWFFNDVLDKFYCREIDAIIDISYDGGIQPCGLALATISIHEDRHRGLIALWAEATRAIRDDLNNGRFRPYCNSCCNHFSRNMLASIMKYPVKNRRALFTMLPLMVSRISSRIYKKAFF
jgi:AdoMet-dependent heme synthase